MGCLAPSNKDQVDTAEKRFHKNHVRQHKPEENQRQQINEEERERMRIRILNKKNLAAPKLHLENNHLYKDRLHHHTAD